jgi:hypothetical protein
VLSYFCELKDKPCYEVKIPKAIAILRRLMGRRVR